MVLIYEHLNLGTITLYNENKGLRSTKHTTHGINIIWVISRVYI